MTTWWSIEFDLDLGHPGTAEEAKAIEVSDESIAVSGAPSGLVASTWVEAANWEDAAEQGPKIALALEPYEIAGVRIRTEQRVDQELAQPTIPTLLGASEVADLLGVSRQRVHQLHRENAAFPPPLVEVAMGPLWDEQAIDKFAQAWDRKPGRPASQDDGPRMSEHERERLIAAQDAMRDAKRAYSDEAAKYVAVWLHADGQPPEDKRPEPITSQVVATLNRLRTEADAATSAYFAIAASIRTEGEAQFGIENTRR
jgi:hypothetical protein